MALFTFVARDPVTGSAMRVNRLAPTTGLERARFAERQDIADKRRAARRAASESTSLEGNNPMPHPAQCNSGAPTSPSGVHQGSDAEHKTCTPGASCCQALLVKPALSWPIAWPVAHSRCSAVSVASVVPEHQQRTCRLWGQSSLSALSR